VIVDGARIDAMGEDALARFSWPAHRHRLSVFHLIPTMTALENIAAPLELAGARDAFARAAAELALVGLSDRQSHYPAQLSAASSSAWRSRAPWRRDPP